MRITRVLCFKYCEISTWLHSLWEKQQDKRLETREVNLKYILESSRLPEPSSKLFWSTREHRSWRIDPNNMYKSPELLISSCTNPSLFDLISKSNFQPFRVLLLNLSQGIFEREWMARHVYTSITSAWPSFIYFDIRWKAWIKLIDVWKIELCDFGCDGVPNCKTNKDIDSCKAIHDNRINSTHLPSCKDGKLLRTKK